MTKDTKNMVAEDLQEMIANRVEKITSELMQDKEYREVEVQLDELFNKIMRLLTEEGKELMRDYDTVATYKQSIALELMFEAGMTYGVQIEKVTGIIVKKEEE